MVKILAKILANHLQQILGDLIDDSQPGFIRRRSIFDGVAAAKEIIHHYHSKHVSGYLLKLDFEKAYCIHSDMMSTWILHGL